MARYMYDGYSLAGLRAWARDLGIKGRSKMGGHELLAECRAENFRQVQAQEEAVLPAATWGALLRHKSTGDIIRVTSEVLVWEPYGTRYVEAVYVECAGWGGDRRADRARYQNECDERRTDGGPRHPLYQYEAV